MFKTVNQVEIFADVKWVKFEGHNFGLFQKCLLCELWNFNKLGKNVKLGWALMLIITYYLPKEDPRINGLYLKRY
jgi:hypothetical protein